MNGLAWVVTILIDHYLHGLEKSTVIVDQSTICIRDIYVYYK